MQHNSTTYRVLTLIFAKDKKTFSYHNYLRVVHQRCAKQDTYVVSAEPIPVQNNIVVKVDEKWPVPIRVALSFNAALNYLLSKGLKLSNYDYIFKVDNDIKLPLDYICRNLKSKSPVAGIGAAMLISIKFYLGILRGKYPVTYCDDGYVIARAIALGIWPPFDAKGVWIPEGYSSYREFLYGYEYYKQGWTLPLILILMLLNTLRYFACRRLKEPLCRRKPLSMWLTNIAGYIWALSLEKVKRYEWSKTFSRYRILFILEKAKKALARNKLNSRSMKPARKI